MTLMYVVVCRVQFWLNQLLTQSAECIFWTKPSEAFRRPIPSSRRGVKLFIIALILGLRGLGVALGQSTPSADLVLHLFIRSIREFAPGWLTNTGLIDQRTVGWAIVALCAFAMFTSFCLHGRDRYGYNCVAIVAMGWLAVYLVAPLSGASLWVSLQSFLMWAFVMVFILYSAKDPEISPETGQCVTLTNRWRWQR